ncbi:MAG: DNA repair protein RadC [Gemmatimonadetes bacterium]|uniref:DNA repair protein RadC n=1 Tax=Candidatus Kutchimonas denitrificans TaxID=3056748 RepID=A0AAE4Z5U4_9BACT|nr:DNA repair protein RadC [Gemmatimonadota bacterium]NIR73894.1 DNA repair protein RadC [Candidatus Kutchimonas denitrificans]NIR99700.1 DNA repair protein RadC [Gemmatimonadota bacterium]NIT65285.1 DNA repair protein RadC [Gemmatimonadota bacterium]NIW73734.1 DNA repair protein RadC [Gemmatimonadota bacterium]
MSSNGDRPPTMKEWPSWERPRERLRSLGPAALRTAELLAILTSSGAGGRNALEIAENLYERFGRSLRRLGSAPGSQLMAVPGIGAARATAVQAALELGRRAAEEVRHEDDRVTTPRDVYRRFELRLRDLRQEEFHVLLLSTQNAVLRDVMVTRGILDASVVHPREVFAPALAEAAAGVILVHNHPSGDPTPSPADREITRQLVDAGRLLGIPVRDHVVVGNGRFASFLDMGLLAADPPDRP